MKHTISTIEDFEYLGSKTYSIGKQKYHIPIYKHCLLQMEFSFIPEGEFLIREQKNTPAYKVQIKHFLISRTPITQDVWQDFVGTTPWYGKKKDITGSKHPAVYINWKQAIEFCHSLSLDLPSESQWEYACRSGTKSKYYWGEEVDERYFWHKENSEDKGHAVAEKYPNAFGLHDMLGNIWEWCKDHWQDSYEKLPRDGTAFWDESTDLRVRRGGSRWVEGKNCHCSYRRARRASSGRSCLGFRLVKNI